MELKQSPRSWQEGENKWRPVTGINASVKKSSWLVFLKMVAENNDAATKEVLFEIAREEKAHLRALGRVLEDHLSKMA